MEKSKFPPTVILRTWLLAKMTDFWFQKGLYLKAIRQRTIEEDTNPGLHVYILM